MGKSIKKNQELMSIMIRYIESIKQDSNLLVNEGSE